MLTKLIMRMRNIKIPPTLVGVVSLAIFLWYSKGFCYELPLKQWFNVNIQGIKVGYCYDIFEKAHFEGKDCLKEKIYMRIDILRFNTKINVESNLILYTKEDLTPLYFRYSEKMGQQEKVLEGKLRNDKLFIKTIFAELTNEQVIPFKNGAILDDLVDKFINQKEGKVGDKFKVRIFSKDTLKFEDIDVEIMGFKKGKILNSIEEFFIVKTDFAGIISTHYLNKKGYTLKSEIPAINATMIKTTQEDALDFKAGNLDLMTTTAVLSNRKINLPKEVGSMSLNITFLDETPEKLFEKHYLIVKERFKHSEALNIPIKTNQTQIYLKPTLYEQSDDVNIVNTAKKIVSNEKNSFKAAKKIINWVYNTINEKNFNIGFNSARETLELKEGDCTEHSVLASALCKASGIPTKVCAGLVPINDKFLYHMWISVYVGKWIDMDPTWNEEIVDASHIKLAEGILDEEGRFKLMLDILQYFNKIKIEIFRIKIKGVEWELKGGRWQKITK